jgi:hypothetical protein
VNEVLKAVTTELAKIHSKPIVEHRSKHLRLVWQAPEAAFAMFISATPSARSAPRNAVAPPDAPALAGGSRDARSSTGVQRDGTPINRIDIPPAFKPFKTALEKA